MSEWNKTTISEIIELIGGGTPETSNHNYWNGDIPWLSVVDFNTENKFVFDTEKKITEKGLNNSSTKLLKKGDVIISARGTIGIIAMLGKEMAFNQSCYGARTKDGISTNDFIYYLLKDAAANLKQISHGGVFDTITRGTFKEIDINLPPLPEQKAIAKVLSGLDDKIDLLHRQNKTLEQMAETLYDSWSFESELESTIKDLIDVQNGYAFQSKSFQDSGNHRVLKIKNISGGVVDIQAADFVSDSIISSIDKRFIINTGDVLFAMTGAKIGKMGIVPQTEKSLWLNQRVGLFKEKFKGTRFLAYLHLKSDFGLDYIENTATGSAQPNISGIGIEKCEFPKLNIQQLTEYSEQLDLFFSKVIFNLCQIHTLEKMRDTLLPKLMSGEVKVTIDE